MAKSNIEKYRSTLLGIRIKHAINPLSNIHEQIQQSDDLFMLAVMLHKTDILLRYIRIIEEQNDAIQAEFNQHFNIDASDDINLYIHTLLDLQQQKGRDIVQPVLSNMDRLDTAMLAAIVLWVVLAGGLLLAPAFSLLAVNTAFPLAFNVTFIGAPVLFILAAYFQPTKRNALEIERILKELPPLPQEPTWIELYDAIYTFRAEDLSHKVSLPNSEGREITVKNKKSASVLMQGFFGSETLKQEVQEAYTHLATIN
jgi:hypothetical protein